MDHLRQFLVDFFSLNTTAAMDTPQSLLSMITSTISDTVFHNITWKWANKRSIDFRPPPNYSNIDIRNYLEWAEQYTSEAPNPYEISLSKNELEPTNLFPWIPNAEWLPKPGQADVGVLDVQLALGVRMTHLTLSNCFPAAYGCWAIAHRTDMLPPYPTDVQDIVSADIVYAIKYLIMVMNLIHWENFCGFGMASVKKITLFLGLFRAVRQLMDPPPALEFGYSYCYALLWYATESIAVIEANKS